MLCKVNEDGSLFEVASNGGVAKYSTTEVKTNDVWIDGKPIYRRVIQTNTPSKADETTEVATLDVSISQIVKIDGCIKVGSASSVGFIPVNGAVINSQTYKGTWVSGNSIYMSVSEYYINRNATIILEYTKTTD